jgi:hypothetical protein
VEGLVSTDRRILKAFYTQYVAVLLIVLTFTIGAYQRSSDVAQAGGKEVALVKGRDLTVGDINISDAFTADGSVISGNERLEAVVSVLENHDLTATITLLVPRLDLNEQASSLRRALRKLEALEDFFGKGTIPPGAVRFVARTGTTAQEELGVRFFRQGRR